MSAQQASIVAFDGATTPATHTFSAIGVSFEDADMKAMIAEWREIILTVPEYAQTRLTMRRRLLKNDTWRITVGFDVPVMESISGQNASGYTAAPKVAYTNGGSVVFYFSRRATAAERRFVRQLLLNLVGGIATTVAVVTTGNAAELIDLNVFPS